MIIPSSIYINLVVVSSFSFDLVIALNRSRLFWFSWNQIQKFRGGPEILDHQFFRSNRNAVHVPEQLDTVLFWIITKASARSSNSGNCVLIITKASSG